ncbi:hypothetical protein CISIN_1g0475241mg, partial [Citrus sinensis]
YAGDSQFGRKNFFSRVGLYKGNPFKYEVTKFLYATSSSPLPAAFIFKSLSSECWHKESNWIGYIAVACDEGKAALGRRDILTAWLRNEQVLDEVERLLGVYDAEDEEASKTITSHTIG